MDILSNISSVIQPGRTTLLLGPPAAGKSTLLKALAGKLARERGLKVRFASFKTPCELIPHGSMLQSEPLLAGSHELARCRVRTVILAPPELGCDGRQQSS